VISVARVAGGIPDFRGASRRLGEPAREAFGVGRVGCDQHGGPGRHSKLGHAGIDVVGRQQAEATVAVFRVVSGEEDLAVEPGRASWIEPNRSGNPGRYFIEQSV